MITVFIFQDGFVFRLSVCHNREISLLKETSTPLGQIKYKDTEESIALEMEISHMPKLTATLHG
jgi:U3 small nucleolar RNA-associated protein 22